VVAVVACAPVAVWCPTLPTNSVPYSFAPPLGCLFPIRSLWVLHPVKQVLDHPGSKGTTEGRRAPNRAGERQAEGFGP
jgi:hypothetical protein